MLLEGRAHDLARVARPVLGDRLHGRVEHERDPGEVLHRAVVEEERQPPPLVLLGRDQPVGELRALVLADPGVREQPRVVELDVLVTAPLADDEIDQRAAEHDGDEDDEQDGQAARQSMIASRRAIATACVRVSASSFARMCRTWLFTVS